MLATSPEPGSDFAIHDHSGFHCIEISEHEELETVVQLASLIIEHGDVAAAVYARIGALEATTRLLAERYQGAWSSLEAWADARRQLHAPVNDNYISPFLQCNCRLLATRSG